MRRKHFYQAAHERLIVAECQSVDVQVGARLSPCSVCTFLASENGLVVVVVVCGFRTPGVAVEAMVVCVVVVAMVVCVVVAPSVVDLRLIR